MAHRKNPEEKQRIGQTYFPDYNDLYFGLSSLFFRRSFDPIFTSVFQQYDGKDFLHSSTPHEKYISVCLNLQPKTFFQSIYFLYQVKKLSCTLLTSISSISQSFLAYSSNLIWEFILFSVDSQPFINPKCLLHSCSLANIRFAFINHLFKTLPSFSLVKIFLSHICVTRNRTFKL